MTSREIEKMVYQKFPVSKGEMRCATEKKTMDALRDRYRKQIYEGLKEKKEFV